MKYPNKKAIGDFGENLAVNYLIKEGLRILIRNYRCPKGEIDIIASDKNFQLVFVEVRTRTSSFRGKAEESVDYRKIARLKIIASYYLLEKSYADWPSLRFDVVAVNLENDVPELKWIKNIG
ncbi:MAG: YraN family protein [Eubacteriales bacterium]